MASKPPKPKIQTEIKSGRRTGIVFVSAEEVQQQWWEDEASERAHAKRKTGPVKLYDVVDLVNEINKEGSQGITAAQKQEIAAIQLAKSNNEFYIDPGRLAMINEDGCNPNDHPLLSTTKGTNFNINAFLISSIEAGREKADQAREETARTQSIRDCAACFRLWQRRTRRLCEEHRYRTRNTHENVLTSVPLCPHSDLRLFWFADDAANTNDTWLLDVSDVHPHDAEAHLACKGKMKSADDSVDELAVRMEQSMERRGLRAPNVGRVLRRMPAVWLLKGRDEEEGVYRVAREPPVRLPPREYDPFSAGGRVPLIGQYTGLHRRVRNEGDWRKHEERMEARKGKAEQLADRKAEAKSKKLAGFEVRVALGKRAAESKKSVDTAPTAVKETAKQVTKAKTTPQSSSSKKSKLSEETIYNSDDGLSDTDPATSTAEAPKTRKRKVEAVEQSTAKKQKKTSSTETIPSPKPDTETAIPCVELPSQSAPSRKRKAEQTEKPTTKKRKTSPEVEVTQQPTPDTDVSTPPVEIASQSIPSKEREVDETEEPIAEDFHQPIAEEAQESINEETQEPINKGPNALNDRPTQQPTLDTDIPTSPSQPTPPTSPKKRKASSASNASDALPSKRQKTADDTESQQASAPETLSASSDADDEPVPKPSRRRYSNRSRVEDEVDYGSDEE